VGTMWIGGRARESGVGWSHVHVDGMVLGELRSVVAILVASLDMFGSWR
jgi:hypothetical protein